MKYLKIQGNGSYWLDKMYSGGPHLVSDEVYEEAFALMKAGAPFDVFESDEELDPESGKANARAGVLTKRDLEEGSEREPDPEVEAPAEEELPPPPASVTFPCDVEGCDRVGERAYASAPALKRHKDNAHKAVPVENEEPAEDNAPGNDEPAPGAVDVEPSAEGGPDGVKPDGGSE